MRSSAVDEEEACSAMGIADILIESVEADVKGGIKVKGSMPSP